MVFETIRNVAIVAGCVLMAHILAGFITGLVQGVRSGRRPLLRIFVGESDQ